MKGIIFRQKRNRQIAETGTKKCSICKETKNVDQFGKDKSMLNGYRSGCTSCMKRYTKKLYIENNRYHRKSDNPFYRKTLTEEHKRKLGVASRGRKHSEEAKRKMSLSNMGAKSYLWQGGKSFEPYTPEFNENLKEKIRNRDNRLCQLCGKTEKENKRKLAVHHLDYIKENCNEENLIALCCVCNLKVNINRIFWTGFFTCYLVFKLFKTREVN